MSWLLGRKPGEPAQLAAVEKLRGYYDLAQEAIERAYQADTSGDSAQAVKLYRVAVQAMHEGLQVPAQGTAMELLVHHTLPGLLMPWFAPPQPSGTRLLGQPAVPAA